MQGLKGVEWVVLESSPHSKTVFLKDLLKKRFPHCNFNFHAFYDSKSAKKALKLRPSGVIAELKTFSQTSLKLFDRFFSDYREIPHILILSPAGFQLLNQKRKDKLHQAMIALSETTSLDYLIQLPRLIEEAGRKRLLKAQNERLQRLLKTHTPSHSFGPSPLTEIVENRKAISEIIRSDCIDGREGQCGLRIQLRQWRRHSRQMGEIAQNEVLELISRLINKSVRNSDRVLRSKEDEFTIFLAHTDASHLTRCKERIERTLSEIRISTNQREVELPFSISPINSASI